MLGGSEKMAHTKNILLSIFLISALVYSQNKHASPLRDTLVLHHSIDTIMQYAIQQKAFPGAQLLVSVNGKTVFHKTYGFHTYDSVQRVSETDLYDLASVTKILGPLPALMKLVDEGKLDLDVPFSTYWKPWRSRTDKSQLTLRQILSHQAGLQPYIVFLNDVLKKGKLKKRFIKKIPHKRYNKMGYEGLYVKNRFRRKIFRKINRSPVDQTKKYRYSGLSFLLFPELITQLTQVEYPTYLDQTFYAPLGSTTLGFLPKTKGFSNAIIPTERDTLFRNTLVKGWVHDENAALMGGVSGNAGLFGSARDVANLMEFYVQGGHYQGKQYISKKTVSEFIKIQYPENENRRGLGFDKPLLNNSSLPLAEAYPAPEVSPESFGHSGFTGTFVWADPKNQLVFIFLSNRVYPSRDHRQLYDLHIRTMLQSTFYQHLN